MEVNNIQLKRGKERVLTSRHPWIFSGAVERGVKAAENGSVVSVLNSKGQFLGVGHFQQSSIAVRWLSFQDETIDSGFYEKMISRAWKYRLEAGVKFDDSNNCCRLINGEGDGLPGLIADRYDSLLVLQFHSSGMFFQRSQIAEAFSRVFQKEIEAIYFMPLGSVRGSDSETQAGYFAGDGDEFQIRENGIQYFINPELGQKTGFFLDQRDNRLLVNKLARGKRVLNAFCYTGGFSLAALKGGATSVESVDISSYATEQCSRHLRQNGFSAEDHPVLNADVMEYLKEDRDPFDLVVLDPPAFAKSRKKSHNAVQAYKRLNVLGLKNVGPGGIVLTFSCSQVIDRQLFEDTIRAAAIDSGRNIRIFKNLGPAVDHPVNIFHKEGHYLKGLALYVD